VENHITLKSPTDHRWIGPSIAAYYAGSLVVLLGAVFGFEHVLTDEYVPSANRQPTQAFARWDGVWYTRITNEGYFYDPEDRSSVAFFPLYPILGKAVSTLTTLPADIALLIVAHAFLLGCFILLHAYVASRTHAGAGPYREEHGNPPRQPTLAAHTLLAFAFWPTTFFFRMAYAESLFVFLCMLALYGIKRGWRPWVIALVCGAATATRPVGVALLLPLAWYLWTERLRNRHDFGAILKSGLLCALACGGLLAYMAYQQAAFGDALAFAKTQKHWTMGDAPSGNKLLALFTLEPIWSVYVPDSPGYWAKKVPTIEPLFNLQAANPIYFLIAVGLVAYGAWRRWLNVYEVLLSIGLIAIPYVTRSYEMCMASQGRFVAAVFPMYIVMGELLRRIPDPWSTLVVAPSAFLLGIYAALFAAGFVLI
jgi:hypothetical protein